MIMIKVFSILEGMEALVLMIPTKVFIIPD